MSEGCFTTVRVLDERVLFWSEHARRLEANCKALGLDPPDPEILFEEISRVSAGMPDVRLRIGVAPRGCVIKVGAYRPPRRPWKIEPVCEPGAATRDGIKSLSRDAYRRARKAAPEADDALLVTDDGCLLECTIGNIFLVCGKDLCTPPAADPILPGIARALVLRHAGSLGYRPVEAAITLDEARRAEACFVTNAVLVAHPVADITGVARFSDTGAAQKVCETLLSADAGLRIIQ